MERIASLLRGLVLVTGTTSSGKSTTLAALIDRVNATRQGHILTLEDPVEYVHTDKECSVAQREVSIDTMDFKTGLRAIMREDPNVILIGEMRDAETFQTCLGAAETGHLVISTLHTTNVAIPSAAFWTCSRRTSTPRCAPNLRFNLALSFHNG